MGFVKVKNVKKKYGTKVALEDVSLSLESGKIYGLIGKNGAGKSTLLKSISRLIRYDEGDISVGCETIGALIEEPAAYQNLNAIDNLKLYMSNYGHVDINKIHEVLDKVGIEDGKKKVKKYSLGMHKRLGIAMSMINNPDLLILDEPTSGLDIEGINDVRNLLRQYVETEDAIILISSHDTRDLAELCEDIFIMDKGKIINHIKSFDGDPIELERVYLEGINGGALC
ncbi:MAG: ABC transporter ATP-binding protein [Lachnospiraceae bacterium]|nr:ABC transporter ATP-binding protein [Lachnospiraceae bacterium]